MERSEFAYPPLHDSSDEEAEDGENYLLDVEEMKSPVRTPVINDTSNSFGSDHLDGNLDSLLQAPDFNLYDNLIDECPQESVEVRCERQETELAECQQMIESLRAQLVAEQCKNKKLSKSLHATLATFRTERNQKEETINELKQRSQRLLAVSCPYCDKGFDANSASTRRPSPANTRILRGQCVVELKFGNYDTLRAWVLAADLETNTDGLPTLPDSLADSLLPAKQPQPLSLASAGSQLVRPVKKQPLSPDPCGTVEENDCKRSTATEMPTKVKSGIPSPPILMHAMNKRIPKKCLMPPLRSKNDNKADGQLRPGRRGDPDRCAPRRRSRSRSRSSRMSRRPSPPYSRKRKRSRERMSPPNGKSSRSRSRSFSAPRRRSLRRRSPSPARSKQADHDRQRRVKRHSQQSTVSTSSRASSGPRSPRKRQLPSPKKPVSGVKKVLQQKRAAMVGRIEADRVTRDVPNRRASPPSLGGADNIERRQVVGCKKERREKQQQSNSRSLKTAARCDEQQSERELRLNSPAATIHKDAEKMDALHRPSLPITPVPQSPARSTAKQSCLESTVFSLPDASDGSLDLDFIRQALRVGQDLSPKLSPVKPLTPRGLTPLRQALTPCAQASSSSNSVKERRTVTPLKISVVRPAMGGKARVSGKLAAMLLMKLEDEAKERSEGELSSDDEAADENDATTTRVDSCSPNVTQSAAADRKSIWMNSLRKNLQL